MPSWHHRLRGAGHRVESIGKLHFRSTDDDNGFTEERIPLHVVEGLGDLMGLVREDLPVRGGSYKIAKSAEDRAKANTPNTTATSRRKRCDGCGGSVPERRCALDAVRFLGLSAFSADRAAGILRPLPDRPRSLAETIRQGRPAAHPYLRDYAGSLTYDDYFDEETVRVAIAAYYGLCSFLDDNIGQVLAALADAGLAEDTRVLYTSDHGDNLGSRGLWGKSTMYEETAAVPLIMAGPDIPKDRSAIRRSAMSIATRPFSNATASP